jgi:O-antigen ligase
MRVTPRFGQQDRQGANMRAFLVFATFVFTLVGGLLVSYSLVPAFIGAAAIFTLGLWLITSDTQHLRAKPVVREETPESTNQGTKRTLTDRLVPIYLLFVWVYVTAPLAFLGERNVGEGAVQAAASGGSLDKQAIILSYGLVGMLFLPRAIQRLDTTFRWLLVLWALYLGWAYVSLFWSVAPDMTVRRLVAFGLVSMGSVGLGAGFYGSRPGGRARFLRHIIVASVISSLLLLVPLTLSGGLAGVFDPSYRVIVSGDFYSYAVRPATIALLILAAAPMLGLLKWRRLDLLAVPVLCLVLFVLKTRGPILYALIAFAVVYLLYKFRAHERVFQLGFAVTVALGLYIAHIEGLLKTLAPYFTRDNAERTMNLTGRVPLWDILAPEIEERPLIGAGFAAFWNPETLYLIKSKVGFPVVSAHNGFLEVLLSTGVIGLSLFLVFWISMMVVALKKVRTGDQFGWLVFMIMLYYLIHNFTTSLIDSYLEVPFIMVFVFLGLLACRPSDSPQPNENEQNFSKADPVATRATLPPNLRV